MPYKRKQRKRKNVLGKRRSQKAQRLIGLARRFGLAGAFVVALVWAGSWAVLSGAAGRFTASSAQQAVELSGRAGFRVENILVEGRLYTSAETIKTITNVRKGDPILSFDPRAAQRMIEKLSWVRAAQVERRLPDTIYIGLDERSPFALWREGRSLALIDAEGVILTRRELERFSSLIIVSGKGAPENAEALLNLLAAEPVLQERVDSAVLIGGRRWDLVLKNGTQIQLPEQDPGLALRRLVFLHEDKALLDAQLRVIDVRQPDRVSVRTRPGAVQEYKAGFGGEGGL